VRARRILWLSALPVLAVVLGGLFLVFWKGEEESVLHDASLGGATTRVDASRNSFALPAANISGQERRIFELGDSFFTQNWVTAPASTTSRDGLGPIFNAQACSSCHVLDGRGAPPSGPDDTATRGLLVRLSVPGRTDVGAPMPEPTYGDQLQDRAIAGVQPEGRMTVTYADVNGKFGDGSAFTLRKPTVALTDLAYGPLAPGTMTSPRIAPQVIGMGLLEAIPDATISSGADPNDRNGDGVSGRVNVVWDAANKRKAIGRFGWKANQPTVADQTSGAFHGDIGITSPVIAGTPCSEAQTLCRSAPTGGEPEIDAERLSAVVFYSRILAVPAMRNHEDKTVGKGSREFVSMGCAACHTSTVKTGNHEVSAVSNQTIHPFTDLLLHDMGPELADGRPDFEADGNEWRTPPLWGLGLSKDVNGHLFLLHDGRARSFEEAILWHGGEGEQAKEKFRTADAKQRAALIKYLESL
jgi:CxxC motif-containing protein (DUF1111 family)